MCGDIPWGIATTWSVSSTVSSDGRGRRCRAKFLQDQDGVDGRGGAKAVRPAITQ
jgi:hypothetical protein